MKKTFRIASVFAVGLALSFFWVAPAHAAGQVDEYRVRATINNDGSIDVAVTINLQSTDSVVQTFAMTRETTDRRDYAFRMTDIHVSDNGQEVPSTTAPISVTDTEVKITLPALTQPNIRTFSYKVHGAAMATPDGETQVTWDFLQGLNMTVGVFEAEVDAQQRFNMIDCAAGNPHAPSSCTYYSGGTHDTVMPIFNSEHVAAGDVVRITMRFPAGSITPNQQIRDHWTFDRAFSVGPLELLIALGTLIVGCIALWLVHRRFGRDVSAAASTRIAEFKPIGEGVAEFQVLDQIRPGLVGIALDEHVDPIDVTATLLDLAVRGHLRIEELPSESPHAKTDWSFSRLQGKDELAPYEQTLLNAITAGAQTPGQDPVPASEESNVVNQVATSESLGEQNAGSTPTKVSTLAGPIREVIHTVQSQLYDEVVARGWFARRPDATRHLWSRLAWIALGLAVLITIVLAIWTSFGLLGLCLLVLALGMLFVAQEMPARTSKGVGVLRGLHLLSSTLETQSPQELPTNKRIEQVSAILPYTVVLGGQERWLDALVGWDDDEEADPKDIYWYHAPETWHLRFLPDSLRNFVTTVQGTLFTR